ncbi:MAG: sigma-70 family RNA polymerase sigma factor [Planctomycetota bacterium]
MAGIRTDSDAHSTAALIDCCRRGCGDAFTVLHDRHAPAVARRVAQRLGARLHDLVDIDDVLQDTFVVAWRQINEGRVAVAESTGGFRSLLVKISLQRIQDLARSHGRDKRDRRRTVSLERLECEPRAVGERPDDVARRREVEEAVATAFQQLAESDRWLIEKRDDRGEAYEEIADQLGCSPPNARLKHFRAKQRLRRLVRARAAEWCGEMADLAALLPRSRSGVDSHR